MTGPEHYREAEQMIEQALSYTDQPDPHHVHLGQLAQAHSALAVAAATALGREGEGHTQPSKDRAAWFDAAAECRKQVQP